MYNNKKNCILPLLLGNKIASEHIFDRGEADNEVKEGGLLRYHLGFSFPAKLGDWWSSPEDTAVLWNKMAATGTTTVGYKSLELSKFVNVLFV